MAKRKSAEKKEKKAERSSKAPQKTGLGLHMKYLIISGKDEMKISRSAHGTVEDISISGLTFQAQSMRIDDLHLSYNDSPSLRNKLTLEIDLPGGQRVTAMGEVSWYERSFAMPDKDYHIGVTFKEIHDEDRSTLKRYLVSIDKTVEPISLDVL